MGYTHMDKICGVNGLFTGAAGSEVDIKDDAVQQTMCYTWATTATQSWYTAAPVAGDLASGYLVHAVAAATTNAIQVLHGTAGAALMSFAAEAGTVGTITTGTTTGTVAVTAGELLKVTMTASATSVDQVYSTIVLVFDKT